MGGNYFSEMKLTYHFDCANCGEPHAFDFTPSRPAPPCSNHDSPAFSDSGDPADIDGPEKCNQCGEEFDFEGIVELAEQFCEPAITKAELEADRKRDEWIEREIEGREEDL